LNLSSQLNQGATFDELFRAMQDHIFKGN
jgi:hypothetical protein